MNSDLDSLFARLQTVIAEKEQVNEKSAAENYISCLCDGSGIYLQKPTPLGAWVSANRENKNSRVLRYALCPKCDPKPTCRKCDGTGHLMTFNLITQTEDIVPNGCPCQRLAHTVERLNAAEIPQRYMAVDFSTLSFAHLAPEPGQKLKLLAQAAHEFCDLAALQKQALNPGLDKPFLTLMGPVGSGKTHIAVSALKRLIIAHNFQAKFLDFTSFLGSLRHAYASKTSEAQILEACFNAEVLLIDELGKGRTENEWQLEKLDDLINERYNYSKVTILTTNYLHADYRYDPRKLGLKEIPANESFWKQSLQDRIGARMYDRLLQSSQFLIFLGVDSFRRRQLEDIQNAMGLSSV